MEVTTHSLDSISPQCDISGPGALDGFQFNPDQSRYLCYLVILETRPDAPGFMLISTEATEDLLSWDASRCKAPACTEEEEEATSPLLFPLHGVVTKFCASLLEIDPDHRSGWIIRRRSSPDEDRSFRATRLNAGVNSKLIECSQFSRHLSSCRVISGIRSKEIGNLTPIMCTSSDCLVYPLSAWLWFNLTLIPPILHQMNRALLSVEFCQTLRLFLKFDYHPTKFNTVLIPDRLDATPGMLRDKHLATMCDAELGRLDSGSELDRFVPSTNKRIAQVPDPCQLLEATTALGACEVINLECLEFLGDAFLAFQATLHVFQHFPVLTDEGRLSKARSSFVSNRTLCAQVVSRRWYNYCTVRPFSSVDHLIPPCYILQSSSADSNSRSHVTFTEKSLADILEAVTGSFLRYVGFASACNLLHSVLGLDDPLRQPGWCSLHQSTIDLSGSLEQSLLSSAVSTLPDEPLTAQSHLCSELLHYQFQDPSLLRKALTHSSAPLISSSDTYERLEFLGDAVLNYVVSIHLMDVNPNYDPGQLSADRSRLVNNYTLAYAVVHQNIHPYILHKVPLLFDTIKSITKIHDQQFDSLEQITTTIDENCAGQPTKILGDVFEALVGAVFLDSRGNLKQAMRCIQRLYGPLLYMRQI